MEFELEVYVEICCELCNDIIHNHIDCPICKTEFAPTNIYGSLYDETELECEICNTIFVKINTDDSWYNGAKVKVKTNE